jgi:hypothetical protein
MVEQVLETRKHLIKLPEYRSYSPGVLCGIGRALKMLAAIKRPPEFGPISEMAAFLKILAESIAPNFWEVEASSFEGVNQEPPEVTHSEPEESSPGTPRGRIYRL